MTSADELMALAGKVKPGDLHASEVDGWWCVSYDLSTPGGAGFAVDGDCWTEADAQFIAAACNFVRSDAFRAMARDAAIGRAYSRWYGAAQGSTDVIADAAHAAIVRDAAAIGAGEE